MLRASALRAENRYLCHELGVARSEPHLVEAQVVPNPGPRVTGQLERPAGHLELMTIDVGGAQVAPGSSSESSDLEARRPPG